MLVAVVALTPAAAVFNVVPALAASKSGAYTWKKTAGTLTFTRVSDSPLCSGRTGLLAHLYGAAVNGCA